MLCQSAPDGEAHFVSTMDDHMNLCGQLVRAFGNDLFKLPAPFDEVVYVVENHDRGWNAYDARPHLNPETRLPYIMSQTPLQDALVTNKGSPDLNEAHNPYCGLLSSMHTCGIYNGRYGLSQFKVPLRKRTVAEDAILEADLEAMLHFERQRQERLKRELSNNPVTAEWVKTDYLLANFKRLQFFDTLSLYFQLRHPAHRSSETFIHVPVSPERDVSVTVKKLNAAEYSLEPFPFATDRLTIKYGGWYLRPFPAGSTPAQLGAVLQSVARDIQTVTLLAG